MRTDAPSRDELVAILRIWASGLRSSHPEVIRVGYFGSYARGDYVPSSDLDVFVEVAVSPHARWFDRSVDFPYPSSVPVGVELFIYTSEEMERMRREKSGWLEHILSEVVWV